MIIGKVTKKCVKISNVEHFFLMIIRGAVLSMTDEIITCSAVIRAGIVRIGSGQVVSCCSYEYFPISWLTFSIGHENGTELIRV